MAQPLAQITAGRLLVPVIVNEPTSVFTVIGAQLQTSTLTAELQTTELTAELQGVELQGSNS